MCIPGVQWWKEIQFLKLAPKYKTYYPHFPLMLSFPLESDKMEGFEIA